MQVLGIQLQVEQQRFSQRVPVLLPALVACLQRQAAASAEGDALQQEGAAAEGDGLGGGTSGWQEAYYGLLLLEKALGPCKSQVGALNPQPLTLIVTPKWVTLACIQAGRGQGNSVAALVSKTKAKASMMTFGAVLLSVGTRAGQHFTSSRPVDFASRTVTHLPSPGTILITTNVWVSAEDPCAVSRSGS